MNALMERDGRFIYFSFLSLTSSPGNKKRERRMDRKECETRGGTFTATYLSRGTAFQLIIRRKWEYEFLSLTANEYIYILSKINQTCESWPRSMFLAHMHIDVFARIISKTNKQSHDTDTSFSNNLTPWHVFRSFTRRNKLSNTVKCLKRGIEIGTTVNEVRLTFLQLL